MRSINQLILLAFCSVIMVSCGQKSGPNTLTESEKKDGWVLLFDGQTTNGWHLFNKPAEPSAWFVSEGELKTEPANTNGTHGDLVTDKTYENFDLTFEWKISKGGNSGVFINVKEDTSYRAAWATGPEYQLYDNYNAPENYLHGGLHSAGAIFGVSPVQNNAKPKPNGEWNQSRILQKNGHISFWLNGVLSAEEDITSAHWKELVAGGGMKAYPDFGKAVSGHIALQDWAKGVAARNIKIRSL